MAEPRIDALRSRGAERFDPVGFRFIEALARRAATHRGEARRLLDGRLARALADFGERLDRAAREAGEALASDTARFPEAAESLRALCEAGDLGAMRRLLAMLEARGDASDLAELLARLAADAPEPRELKSVRYFRRTWSKLRVDRRLSHAFSHAPENAGPLNSHFLVLRSLRLMGDIAPAYLEQFISYADALLWLDQADSGGPAQTDTGRRPARKRGR